MRDIQKKHEHSDTRIKSYQMRGLIRLERKFIEALWSR